MTNLLTMKPTIQDSDKEETLNKQANSNVSEEHLASGGRAAKQEVSETVKEASFSCAIAGIFDRIDDKLTAMTSPRPDDGKMYGESHITAMMQTMIEKVVSSRFQSINFEIRLCRTVEDIKSLPRYLVKVTEVLLTPMNSTNPLYMW